jgi:hypothetical protein
MHACALAWVSASTKSFANKHSSHHLGRIGEDGSLRYLRRFASQLQKHAYVLCLASFGCSRRRRHGFPGTQKYEDELTWRSAVQHTETLDDMIRQGIVSALVCSEEAVQREKMAKTPMRIKWQMMMSSQNVMVFINLPSSIVLSVFQIWLDLDG